MTGTAASPAARIARALASALINLVRRAGWAGALGVVLITIGLVSGLLVDRHVADVRRELAREHARLLRAQATAATGQVDSERTRLARFYAKRFPGESELPARLARVYAAADTHGIAIRRADYRMAAEPATPLRRVSLSLPLQGDFARIHAWLRDLLVQLPELALEGLSIRRAGSEASTLEAEIRLVLFVRADR